MHHTVAQSCAASIANAIQQMERTAPHGDPVTVDTVLWLELRMAIAEMRRVQETVLRDAVAAEPLSADVARAEAVFERRAAA